MRHVACLVAALLPLLAGCATTTSTSRSGAASASATTTGTPSAPPLAAPPVPAPSRVVTTASGLQIEDLVIGDGALAENGMEALVHYTGWFTDGRKFDSSYDREKPYRLFIGRGEVIRGWDEGLLGMRVGGKRRIVVPPSLGYGSAGKGNLVPPDVTLVFELQIMDLR